MRLTNKHNLPEVFVRVLSKPTYSKGKADLSVTELLQPPQLVQLVKKHWNDLEEDVSDKISALFGTAVHVVLEMANDKKDMLVEERIHARIDGWDISGALDVQKLEIDGTIIQDYKVTKVWSVMNEKAEWEQQLNIYAWLVSKMKGIPVKKAQIIAIIKDWSELEAGYKANYPETSVQTIDVSLWTMEAQTKFIRDRIHAHSSAALATELEDPYEPCTPAEMWEKPTKYAVIKTGNKKATAVFEDENEANAMAMEKGKGFEVVVRSGERTRCKRFCIVKDFCPQYQQYLKEEV